MRSFVFLVLPLLLLTCSPETLEELTIDDLQERFAPDKRTDRVEMTVIDGRTTAYTTVPEAYDSLRARLGPEFPLRLLPDTALLGERTAGIITTPVANLRSEPGHSRELASQALGGTPIRVLDSVDGWFLVRTPDRYLAWLEPGAFTRMTPGEAERRLRQNDTISTAALYEPPLHPAPGGIQLPLHLRTAAQMTGKPYLWGGTGPHAMDCSGLTRLVYQLNGYVIPRDASQQVHAGTEVPLGEDRRDLSALIPGDLIFFGNFREDGSERITHVGFYLGDGRFLHAGADNGVVRENSLIEGDADFAPHRLETLLRARRLQPGDPGVVPLRQAYARLLTE